MSLVVPLSFERAPGELQQVLTWTSEGAWQLRETISYRGLPGDETLVMHPGQAGTYAAAYASLITQLNETGSLRLFVDGLPQDLDPQCSSNQTRVRFLIRDRIRNEEARWTRCTQGSLGDLRTTEAGPDAAASRLVQAAILVRDYTQGPSFASAYLGSIPFGTLSRVEDSGAEPLGPRKFFSIPKGSDNTPPGWIEFWREHTGDPQAEPPEVDWTREVVLVAAVGLRTEAGDSVEVRRVLQTGEGTQVKVVERLPGNFCSPASRRHYPAHVVVTPRPLQPIEFSDPATELVPCGI